MLSYREYLSLVEEWQRDQHGNFNHRANVGDHEVTANMEHSPKHPGHYEVSYSVNGSMHRSSSGAHSTAVLHHVHRAINDFVREHKPNGIRMGAYDRDGSSARKKDRVYQKLGAHLAKRHGGVHHHDSEERVSSVTFGRRPKGGLFPRLRGEADA